MKNVLILSGSPRKRGNSDMLCDQFYKGADEAGNRCEKMYLQDMQIGFCTACYACRENGRCIQKDSMTEVLEKMIQADVIVLATPVYFYSMAGQMKTFIDRTLPRYTEIRNKHFYFIVTAADGKASMQRAVESLQGFTDCLSGSKVVGVVYGAEVWSMGDIQDKREMTEAYELGKSIEKRIAQ